MTQLTVTSPPLPDEEAKKLYAGMYVLKKLDLKPSDGGMTFPMVLPSDLTPLEDVLMDLSVNEYVTLNRKKERWDLTRKGLDYLAALIDEAEDLIEEFEEDELPDVVAELRRRNQDVFRARFLWGWFDGELDDLVLWQQQRGVSPVQTLWAYYLLDDDFYTELAKDFAG